MKVRLINDDWSTIPSNRTIHLVIKVGDPIPEKGKEYNVVCTVYHEGKTYYELEGLDYSNYPGGHIYFGKERFEISDDTFVPNTVIDGMPARAERCIMSFSFPFKEKLPRKKKKQLKKYGMVWTHN